MMAHDTKNASLFLFASHIFATKSGKEAMCEIEKSYRHFKFPSHLLDERVCQQHHDDMNTETVAAEGKGMNVNI